MARSDLEKPLEVFLWIRTTFYRQKINDLNEELCLAVTRRSDSLNQALQSRQKSIMTDPQQWSARDVTHARRFDHERSGSSFSESPVPIKIVLCDESFSGRPPWHHPRSPRATVELQ